nr:hypothetical protein [Arthrospira sp. SH-MAG29]
MMVIFTGLGALSDGALRGVFMNAIAFGNQNLGIFTDILAVIAVEIREMSEKLLLVFVGIYLNLNIRAAH